MEMLIFKGTVHPKICHNFLTPRLVQIWMNFLQLLNTKEDILKNVENVDGSHWLP